MSLRTESDESCSNVSSSSYSDDQQYRQTIINDNLFLWSHVLCTYKTRSSDAGSTIGLTVDVFPVIVTKVQQPPDRFRVRRVFAVRFAQVLLLITVPSLFGKRAEICRRARWQLSGQRESFFSRGDSTEFAETEHGHFHGTFTRNRTFRLFARLFFGFRICSLRIDLRNAARRAGKRTGSCHFVVRDRIDHGRQTVGGSAFTFFLLKFNWQDTYEIPAQFVRLIFCKRNDSPWYSFFGVWVFVASENWYCTAHSSLAFELRWTPRSWTSLGRSQTLVREKSGSEPIRKQTIDRTRSAVLLSECFAGAQTYWPVSARFRNSVLILARPMRIKKGNE